MTDDRHDEDRLATALLAEDRRGQRTAPIGEGDLWIGSLVQSEQAAERRVRRAAIGSWSAVTALVPLLGVAIFLIRVVADGGIRDAVRAAVLVIGVFAILAVVLALLTTVAWLFRPRSASLAAIERRLAALEELLKRRG